MSESDCEKISSSTVKWGIGILIALTSIVASYLVSASTQDAAQDAEIQVLQTRVNSMESYMSNMTNSAASIRSDVNELKNIQGTFQASMEAKMGSIREHMFEVKRLKIGASKDL